MDIVLLFPGQGSQKVGMGRDLHGAFPEARAAFDAVDAAATAPLATLMFEGPADELTRTLNAQPALLAHSAAAWAVLRPRLAGRVVAAAGHSLGEFSAYHAAGSLGLADAARIVRRRGELMYEAGVARPGAMAAILGVLDQPLDALCAQASAERGLVVPANFNSDEQVVVSGEVAGVERVMELAKGAGAKRCLPLPVSGAFHSPLMAPATEGLAAALEAAHWAPAQFPVWANVNAEAVTDPARARALLREQLTATVQWTAVMRALAAAHPAALFVELGSGSVLAGLARRLAPGVRTATCGTVPEVEALLALAESSATEGG